jgi:PAS domain S-box-containing protein
MPRPTILIVDDDRALSKLLATTLHREGLESASVTSFDEAVEWLQNHSPDLMLLDLKLQEIGGQELVDHLANQGCPVPFIIITGEGDERVAVSMMKRGAIDYLVKDADFLKFLPAVVRRALGQIERDKKLAIAEEALRRSEANLAKAQQIAHLGSYELNVPFSNQDYRSEEIFRILGLGPGQRELSRQEYVQRIVHPADREHYSRVVDESIATAQPFSMEYRVVRPDGSVRAVQSVGETVCDEHGRVIKLVGTLLDITERKRAEEALRKEHALNSAILDTSAALVVVLDRQGTIVRFNRACEQTTGWSASEVIGKLFWKVFLFPDDFDSVKAVFNKLTSGQHPQRHENYWRTRQGERRLIAWSNSALTEEDGKVDYIISIGIDITERRRLEEEILHISELEQRRIGQDLHDGLCQHLAATELMSEILAQKLLKSSKTNAARASEITRHVRDAIGQTRSLARGLSPVVLESEGLMSALHDLAANTERMFRITCEFTCARPVLIHDHTTATHLYRIAQEAVSNAIRHGKARKVRISLDPIADRVVLAIRDDGSGLGREPAKTQGMGLRIMQYRAGIIGGSLLVQDAPGSGVSVSCSIQLTPGAKYESPNDKPKRPQKN